MVYRAPFTILRSRCAACSLATTRRITRGGVAPHIPTRQIDFGASSVRAVCCRRRGGHWRLRKSYAITWQASSVLESQTSYVSPEATHRPSVAHRCSPLATGRRGASTLGCEATPDGQDARRSSWHSLASGSGHSSLSHRSHAARTSSRIGARLIGRSRPRRSWSCSTRPAGGTQQSRLCSASPSTSAWRRCCTAIRQRLLPRGAAAQLVRTRKHATMRPICRRQKGVRVVSEGAIDPALDPSTSTSPRGTR